MNSSGNPRLLPSNATIVLPNHQDLCRTILQVVSVNNLHLPPKKFSHAVDLLWTVNGDGPLDGEYSKWASRRTNRQITERIQSIIAYYSVWDTEYPSDLQVLGRQLADENREAKEAIDATRAEQRRIEEAIQLANDRSEGQLGLLPAGRGVRPPSLGGESRAVQEQNVNATAFLAANPRSQNNEGEGMWSHDDFVAAIFGVQDGRGAVAVRGGYLFGEYGAGVGSDDSEEESSIDSELAAELQYIEDLDNRCSGYRI